MNRVQKINKAVEILHVQHGMTAREIQQYLKDRCLHVDLETLIELVLGLNYSPVNVPRKSKTALRIERLNPILKSLVDIHVEFSVPWRYMASLLNEVGITLPGAGTKITSTNIQRYLRQQDLHRRVGRRCSTYPGLTYGQYCAKLEEQVQQLQEYLSWTQEGN